MTITAQTVLDNVEFYLPESNKLDENQMTKIIDGLILEYGEEDENLPVISCEFLKRVAVINNTLATADDVGLKKEVLGRRTYEWDTAFTQDNWNNYYDQVEQVICPILGVPYEKKFTSGVKINSGGKFCIDEKLYP